MPKTHDMLPLKYDWAAGENVKTGMDANLRLLGAVVQLAVESRTSDEPGTPSDGDRYIHNGGTWSVGNAGDVIARIAGAWYVYPPGDGWWCYVKDEGQHRYYDGGWLVGGGNVQNNWSGGRVPDANDDSDDGYARGSRWVDDSVSPAEIYVCVDATVGSAVWLKTTLTLDELGNLATGDNAADVPINDAGGYYSGTDVEAALQETGADLAGKADTGHSHTEADITDLDKYDQATVDSKVDAQLARDGTQAMTGDLDHGGHKATNLADGTAADDGVTKGQLDAVQQNRSYKDPVRAATDGQNIDLTSATDPNPVDGVTLADGDRVLLKDQTAGAENGIYDAVTATDPTTWVRSADADEDTEVTAGMAVTSTEGANNAEIMWLLTTDEPTLGTDALSFTGFNLAALVAGTGLNKTNNTVEADFASTAEHEAGSETGKVAHPAGVHAAFNQYGLNYQAQAVPGDDANNAVLGGFYRTFSATVNVDGAPSGSTMIVATYDNDSVGQIIIDREGDLLRFRTKKVGTWQPWQRTLNVSDLAANGGNVVTDDRQNEFTAGQAITEAGGGDRLRFTTTDTTDYNVLRNRDSGGFDIFRLTVRNLNGSAQGHVQFRDGDYYDFRSGGVVLDGRPSQGAGTLNGELYDNSNRVSTSDYVFDADQDGEIDTAHYDAAIGTQEVESDTETEEVEEEVEVTETVEETEDEWCPEKGCYERKIVQRERPVMDEYPVLDADGNRISTKRVPRKETRKVQRPKRVEVQLEHKPARRFDHDDLDPVRFAAKCHARRKLPAMDRCEQNLREGQERPSMGEWTQALMETCEVYAVHISRLCDEIDTLKARIDEMENGQ